MIERRQSDDQPNGIVRLAAEVDRFGQAHPAETGSEYSGGGTRVREREPGSDDDVGAVLLDRGDHLCGARSTPIWRAPVALILSRQNVPTLPVVPDLARGVAHGGYVRWQHGTGDDLALIATGSEVSLAVDAARALAEDGVAVRVVSMPSVEWFLEADEEWRESVLPHQLTARVAIEAGRGDAWYRWVGTEGRVLGVETFGESGAGAQVMERRGMSAQAVMDAAREVLAQRAAARPA